MNKQKFQLFNRIIAIVVLIIASYTYISTIEPTASFWDCGEFIASSYKLEVGHPPGNPVFQLFARFFAMFTTPEHVAVAINICSALCSAFTILLLYLTIIFFAKRLVKKATETDEYSVAQSITIFFSGIIGALVYCFSDTFWFSAVEGEVYGMSSLFTALVFWAMLKWYEEADKPHANRWLILICFLMGLSIGVHLLNLLTIPALVFLYFYRQRENNKYNIGQFFGIGIISLIVLILVLYVIIPFTPKLAAYTDLFFVNSLGLPFNTGAAFFVLLLIGLGFWGAFYTFKHNYTFANTIILGVTSIIIGFSLFSIVVIRSNAMPPTNEYQPDNAFTLVRYLSREQYGSAPLLYGQYFGAPTELTYNTYWTPLNGKYVNVQSPPIPVYSSEGKMLFPRMWNNMDDRYIPIYQSYMGDSGTFVPGSKYKKPTFWTNLKFFYDYQFNWMYWRYFMWNFAGRQNDIHSPIPGDLFYGNWECGIPFIDHIRLGNQDNAPEPLKDSKGKNHYYLLPLLLGILGLVIQMGEDKRGAWICFLMFFMMGIAIVLYLNQSPLQVRERDYAYAGSFYAYAIWVGLGVLGLAKLCTNNFKAKSASIVSVIIGLCLLGVPTLMAQQNWDDHNRSNRKTTIEMATNYLNSVGKNGILITHGDNDTFPLWYAQEVEGVRPDVRICNTSLLGTDWHIGQMKYACNKSAPLNLKVGQEQYLYGTNDYVRIVDTRDTVLPLKIVMAVFKDKAAKIELTSGKFVDYIISHKFSIPVNKENVIKYGILDAKFKDQIPDQIVLTIPKNKDYISKPELFMLDLLSNYNWDRPINILSFGGDLNIGIKDYLMYEGFSSKFIPIKNNANSNNIGKIYDAEDLYNKLTKVYSWDMLSRKDYFVDYQNIFTFLGVISQRDIFYNVANIFANRGQDGDKEKAISLLDKGMQIMPEKSYPYESICIGFYNNDITIASIINLYYELGEKDKANKIADKFCEELLASSNFFSQFGYGGLSQLQQCSNIIQYISQIFANYKEKERADNLTKKFKQQIEKNIEGLS